MKKKICFYNGSLRMGGIERILVEVLKNLDKDKYEISLIIEDGIKKLNVFEKEVPEHIKIYYLKSESLIEKTNFYREKKRMLSYKVIYNIMMKYESYIKKKNLKKIIKNKEYDVVIDFDMGLSKYINLIKSKKKIVWVHSNIEKWYKKKLRIIRLGKRLKNYNKIVTICDEMKENTVKLYPFLKNKILRIYNPFDFERIKKLSNKEVNKKLEEYMKFSYFVSIMRLTVDSKDFETLIKGFKLAKEKGIKEKLYILGDGPDKEEIYELIKKEKMEESIFLLGNIENPYPWIKNSKALIHSSKYEGLPTVLIEALILEKTVISSNCPTGPKEILENGEIGFLYEVGDYNKLGEILIKRDNKIKKNRNIDKYNVYNIIKEYEKLLERID